MPIYEYSCEKCGNLTEVMQRVSDPAPETCPQCGATKTMSKVMSRTSFQLKGGGWYSDLYSSTKKEAKASSGGETKAESTPAPKAESKPSGGGSGSSST